MYLCIDIGGTKTLIALLNAQGKILHSIKFATLYSQSEFYANLLMQIRANFTTGNLKAISVAMPGIVHNNKAIWLGNLPWRNFDIAKDLNSVFRVPVYVENDANLAGLAEARNCKGRSLYFTFSTGIGGAVIEDGKLVKKYRDFEPGHNLYTYDKKESEWEDLAAASAIHAKYNCNVTDITDPEAYHEIVSRMLLGLVPLTTSIKPDRIFFGGPLGLSLNLYRKELRERLSAALPSRITMPRLIIAKYDSLSVIHGCYHYAKEQEKRTK